MFIALDDVDVSKITLDRNAHSFNPRTPLAVDLCEAFRDGNGHLTVAPNGDHYGYTDGKWGSKGYYFVIMENFPDERIPEFLGRAKLLLGCDIFYHRTTWWSYVHSFDDDDGENAL